MAIPVIGALAAAAWPYAIQVARWTLSAAGTLGKAATHTTKTVGISPLTGEVVKTAAFNGKKTLVVGGAATAAGAVATMGLEGTGEALGSVAKGVGEAGAEVGNGLVTGATGVDIKREVIPEAQRIIQNLQTPPGSIPTPDVSGVTPESAGQVVGGGARRVAEGGAEFVDGTVQGVTGGHSLRDLFGGAGDAAGSAAGNAQNQFGNLAQQFIGAARDPNNPLSGIVNSPIFQGISGFIAPVLGIFGLVRAFTANTMAGKAMGLALAGLALMTPFVSNFFSGLAGQQVVNNPGGNPAVTMQLGPDLAPVRQLAPGMAPAMG